VSSARGVVQAVPFCGEKEESRASMRGSDGACGEKVPCQLVPACHKVAGDPDAAVGPQGIDVLDEDEAGGALADDADDIVPQPGGVGLALPPAGAADGLAREARSDAIHDATPGPAVEGSQIRPHRRWSQGSLLHAACQDFGAVGFPFNEADRARSGNGQLDAEVDAGDAGAEGQHVEGVTSHIATPSPTA
jgi:hypothetical protein